MTNEEGGSVAECMCDDFVGHDSRVPRAGEAKDAGSAAEGLEQGEIRHRYSLR
jgi:hypothetical protein